MVNCFYSYDDYVSSDSYDKSNAFVNQAIKAALGRNKIFRTWDYPYLKVSVFDGHFVVSTGDDFGFCPFLFSSFDKDEEFESTEEFLEALAGFEEQVAALRGYWPERRDIESLA